MPYFTAIRQDEYPATDELQCIAVHIPAGDEYKALLAGFVAMLCRVESYEDPESAQADGIAAVFDEGYSQTNWDGCGVPPECEMSTTEALITLDEVDVTSGNAVAWAANSAQFMGGVWLQNPPATGDKWNTSRYLAAGEWYYEMLVVRNSGSGRANLTITPDGSTFPLIANLEFYNGSTQQNFQFTGTFTLPTAGKYTIELEGANRNPSSSGWQRQITKFAMWKTDD